MGMFDNYNNIDDAVIPDNRVRFLNTEEDYITVGGTNTHYFRLPVEPLNIKDFIISYQQGLSIIVEKQMSDCELEEHYGSYYVKCILGPQDSILFDYFNKDTHVQLAIKLQDDSISFSDRYLLGLIKTINPEPFIESSEV